MTKLKAPLLSFEAKKGLGRFLTFVRRRGQSIAEKTPIPKDAKTSNQLAWRTMYQLCVDLWHTLSAVEKQAWESAARVHHLTGYQWYMSQCLRPNPGIYLPLLGGIMQGDIDMDGHKIEALPDPAANQDADTQAARNAAIAAHAAIGIQSKVIIADRNMAAASGNVAHVGVGFKPKAIIAICCQSATTMASWGVCDSALQEGNICQRQDNDNMSYAVDKIHYLFQAGGNHQQALIASFDADGFTETWTKTGAPAGTVRMRYVCLR